MPAFDDYIPEELEPSTRALASLLEEVYQQPVPVTTTISSHEQEVILARARARLITASALAVPRQDIRPPLVLLDTAETIVEAKDTHLSQDPFGFGDSRVPIPSHIEKRRRSHFLRFANAIAAVLVVATLIAGSVALFTRHVSLIGEASPKTTMSSVPCFLYEPSNPGFPIDSGLRAVCQQHLYKDLQLVGKAGPYRVTLVRAYADRLRLAVQWKVEQLVNGRYGPVPPPGNVQVVIEKAQTSQGQTFQKNQAPFRPLWGDDGISNDQGQIAWLTAPSILLPATMLSLHLDVYLKGGSIDQGQSIPFQFSLPLQPELRVVAINQTLNINGTPLTIKDMYLSPSEVFLEIADTRGNTDLPTAKLTIGQTTCPDNHSEWFLQANGSSSWNILIGCSAYTAHGLAHLVVSKDYGQFGILGTFDFTVPAS